MTTTIHPVVLSSGHSDGDEESEEMKDDDLERASPPSQRQLLLGLDDDDDANELPAADSPGPVRASRRAESAPSTARASGEAALGVGAVAPPPEGSPHPIGEVKETGLVPQDAWPTIMPTSAKTAVVSPAKAPQGEAIAPTDGGAVAGHAGGHSNGPRSKARATSRKDGGASSSEEEKKRKWATPDEGEGAERKKKKKNILANVPFALKAVLALGRSSGGRGGAQHGPDAILGHTGTTATGRAGAPSPLGASPAPLGGPANKDVVASYTAPLVTVTAAPAMARGETPHPPLVELDSGRAAA
nr:skin secretory protein xP2-like [Aegilops tauschii subsp. strangulata]